MIDVKISNNGNNFYTFKDIKGNNYDAKITHESYVKSTDYLEMFARWINLLIMRKDNEIEHLNNLKSLTNADNLFSVLGLNQKSMITEAERNIAAIDSQIMNLSKIFSDSLKY